LPLFPKRERPLQSAAENGGLGRSIYFFVVRRTQLDWLLEEFLETTLGHFTTLGGGQLIGVLEDLLNMGKGDFNDNWGDFNDNWGDFNDSWGDFNDSWGETELLRLDNGDFKTDWGFFLGLDLDDLLPLVRKESFERRRLLRCLLVNTHLFDTGFTLQSFTILRPSLSLFLWQDCFLLLLFFRLEL